VSLEKLSRERNIYRKVENTSVEIPEINLDDVYDISEAQEISNMNEDKGLDLTKSASEFTSETYDSVPSVDFDLDY
jgi:predicted DNA binding CopG/RHH family protein